MSIDREPQGAGAGSPAWPPPTVEKQKSHIDGLVYGPDCRAVWEAANGEGRYSGFSEAAKAYAKERMIDAILENMERVQELSDKKELLVPESVYLVQLGWVSRMEGLDEEYRLQSFGLILAVYEKEALKEKDVGLVIKMYSMIKDETLLESQRKAARIVIERMRKRQEERFAETLGKRRGSVPERIPGPGKKLYRVA